MRDRPDLAAFGRTDVLGPPDPAQQVVADLLAQELQVLVVADLVADHRDADAEVLGIAGSPLRRPAPDKAAVKNAYAIHTGLRDTMPWKD